MLGEFVEKHRQTLVLLFSVLILAGSGVSLGFGVAEFSKQSPLLQTSGFQSVVPRDFGAVKSEPSGPININTASAPELEALPEIGPALASRIVDYRQQNGSFKTAAEIQNVSGIGPKTYEMIKDQITVK